MRIGIVGSGAIGSTLARLWTTAGHEIAIANSRGPESLAELVASIGPLCHAMTVDETAAFGEIVVLAVPFRRPEALPRPDLVKGKIVVDAMNPYAEGGGLLDLGGKTSSAVTAERLLGARIVKAFNTMHWETLSTAGRPYVPEAQRLAIFLAGDDARAKDRVAQLIREIGFAPVDTGSLAIGGRLQEPGSKIFDQALLPSEARQALARM